MKTLIETWRKSVENSGVFSALPTDLSKAFDCLLHELLIAKIQSITKYLRLTLVSCEIAHYGKSLMSVFSRFLIASTKQEDWALGYHSMKF